MTEGETMESVASRFSAKEQLLEAKRLGHELSLVRREFEGDIPPKIRLVCTCGYESTWRRSEKAALGVLIWHLGKVLGESDRHAQEKARNGIGSTSLRRVG